MKFFNVDLHISVIRDVKDIMKGLGHSVDSVCMSNHAFVFNEKPKSTEVITQKNWRHMDESTPKQFYSRYKDSLVDYDAFIVTYPPSFSLLYEKFDQPIIMQVPIRFEVPFEKDPKKLKWFVDYLKDGIDSKKIIPICNSLYEKKYCEKYTDREWKLIPNICDYTEIDYQGGNKYLLYSRFDSGINQPNIVDEDVYLGRNYNWKKFNHIQGIIHLPYNISTMSLYEHYSACIPLFFPSLDFNCELYKDGKTLTELSWGGSRCDSKEWIAMSDCYNDEWMPYIQHFDSFDHLKEILKDVDTKDISRKMREFNIYRKDRIYSAWNSVVEEVTNG